MATEKEIKVMENGAKASDHESYRTMTMLAVLVPIVGFIVGIVHLTRNTKLDSKLGEHLIATSIGSTILICILLSLFGFGQFFYAPSAVIPQTINTTPVVTTPTWDIEGAYSQITVGMSKSAVETAIKKSPANCAKSEQSATPNKYAACTYGSFNEGGIIIVNYVNDVVTSKEKSQL